MLAHGTRSAAQRRRLPMVRVVQECWLRGPGGDGRTRPMASRRIAPAHGRAGTEAGRADSVSTTGRPAGSCRESPRRPRSHPGS